MGKAAAVNRSELSRAINALMEKRERIDALSDQTKVLRDQVKLGLKQLGEDEYETNKAVAKLIAVESRKWDVAKVLAILDDADAENAAPRKIDAKAMAEILGHHRYEGLEKCFKIKKSRRLEVNPL